MLVKMIGKNCENNLYENIMLIRIIIIMMIKMIKIIVMIIIIMEVMILDDGELIMIMNMDCNVNDDDDDNCKNVLFLWLKNGCMNEYKIRRK